MGLLDAYMGEDDRPRGLLDGFFNARPSDRALMAAANAMLESSGPSTRPVTTMQSLSRGMMAGQDAYRAAQDEEYMRRDRADTSAYRRAQTGAIESKRRKDEQLQNFIMSRLGGGAGGGAPIGQQPGGWSSPSYPTSGQGGGALPAARMGGEVFTAAAQKAGLGADLDIETLNQIVGLVNQGLQPDEAAQRVAQSRGASQNGAGASTQNPFAPAGPSGMPSTTLRQPGNSNGGNAGNAFPFSLQDVTMLKLQGVDLSDIYDMATKPIEMKAGSTYIDRATGERAHLPELPKGLTYDQRGEVTVAPGYMMANGRLQRQEADITERAKANYDPVYGEDAQGNRVVVGSRASVLGYGAGSQQRGPGQQGPQQGYQQPGMPIARSESQKAYDMEMAKSHAENFKNINNAALKAPGQIARLQRIGALLEDHDGGKFSKGAFAFAQAANSLGIKIDPKLGNKEAAQAAYQEMALSFRDPSQGAGMPGAMSDADRQYLDSMTPNMAMSKQGRALMIDAYTRVQRRNIDIQKMAVKYQKKHGRIDENFYVGLQAWAERNPLFGEQE